MIIVGVTGGIGSGKSTVCRILKVIGYPVYESDSKAKEIVNNSKEVKKEIQFLLGEKAYDNKGLYDRSYVASIVFSNPILLDELNAIIHPRVQLDFDYWVKKNKTEILFKESALVTKKSFDSYLSKIIVVTAPSEIRHQRVLQRDPNRSAEEVRKIMERQSKIEDQQKLADYCITNDNKQPLLPQIQNIIQFIKSTNVG